MSSLSRRACYKCGELGHSAEVCDSSKRRCYNCKEPGHESNECGPYTRTLIENCRALLRTTSIGQSPDGISDDWRVKNFYWWAEEVTEKLDEGSISIFDTSMQPIPGILRDFFNRTKRYRGDLQPSAPSTAAVKPEKVDDQAEFLEELASMVTALQARIPTKWPNTMKVEYDQLPVLGIIKNVSKKVDERTLLDTLQRYGELIYFDLARTMVKWNSI
jgi:hypothetical protein